MCRYCSRRIFATILSDLWTDVKAHSGLGVTLLVTPYFKRDEEAVFFDFQSEFERPIA